MVLRIGTSGYSYKEWKGSFYPAELKDEDMLSFYAQHLGTVEINNTFYRLPTKRLLEGWAAKVPDTFRFVLKVSQKITHFKRLKGVEEETAFLVDSSGVLGPKLGALLVQITPKLARDDDRLDAFLTLLGPGMKAAVEVRNPSWMDPGVYAILQRHGAALVASQTDEEPEPQLVRTAPWGYLRLRKTSYAPDEMGAWAQRIADQGWNEAYAFFKHEEIAPGLAERLSASVGHAA